MTLSIQALQIATGGSVYYEDDWHILIETHLPLLRTASDTTVLTIDQHDAFKWAGDFYGLMQKYNQTPEYWYIIMRVNNLFAPYEYPEALISLLIPSRQTIESLRQIYQTISSKTN
jgi:hypothetical protein